MKVKLISVTPEAEKNMLYCARVSNPKNQNSENTKLLNYCIKHGHWSVFEMAHMTVEIETSRGIAAQILRHKTFSFQEFCISGDSLITTIIPSTGAPNYMPIKKLYERQKWGNYKDILVRTYDEKNNFFTTSKIKEVFKTGKKQCYKIFFEDGKNITCTKEHKFFTEKGFLPLEEAIGLTLEGSGKATMSSNAMLLAVNGDVCYQNYDWLKKAKERSIQNKKGFLGIAEEAGVSYHTIKKWLKKLGLKFTRNEVASYTDSWNKGKAGYEIKKWSEENKQKKRLSAPKGKDHHSYKGGASSERKAIANFFNPYRKDIFKKFNYVCQLCFSPFNNFDGKIDLHHVKEVGLYPELAKNIDNIIPVHRKCHMEYHGKSYYFKKVIKRGKANTLVPRFTKVVKVEYVGEIETYDMEIEGENHNYVANRILVHNSQRYQVVNDFEIYPARRQDEKNRQNSIDDMSREDKAWFKQAQETIQQLSMDLYQQALNKNIAKEQARFLLPLSTKTKMYMSGSIRSWIHYLDVRCAEGTQLEHKEIAEAIKVIFSENFPVIAEAKGWKL